MNIGIVGSGHVGGTLGKRWANNGHAVIFSSRHPGSAEMVRLVEEGGKTARAASVAECVTASDVILLATPWPATEAALKSAGDLAGKVVIDATNPLLPDLSGLAVGNTTSGGEQVAQWAAGASIVKAFNTVGFSVMANPDFQGTSPVMFYCGNDKPSKQTVHDLAAELGFDAQDAGPLAQARVLEPFALLWISLAFMQGFSTNIAFQLLRR